MIRIPGLRAPLNWGHIASARNRLRSWLSFPFREQSTPDPFLRKAEDMGALLAMRVRNGRAEPVNTIGPPTGNPAADLHEMFNSLVREKPTGRMLEVGSRARSGVLRRDLVPNGWLYTGLDVLDGPNVDKVGDAHNLSSLFPVEHFDAVMAFSVLEHLLMPWKFAIELNHVLKTGAIGFFATHQTWPVHEMPWDFWRYSHEAWKAILNRATGFEIIDARMGEPAFVVPRSVHPVTNFSDAFVGYLTSAVLFRKIGETALQWPVEVEQITDTSYPAHQV